MSPTLAQLKAAFQNQRTVGETSVTELNDEAKERLPMGVLLAVQRMQKGEEVILYTRPGFANRLGRLMEITTTERFISFYHQGLTSDDLGMSPRRDNLNQTKFEFDRIEDCLLQKQGPRWQLILTGV